MAKTKPSKADKQIKKQSKPTTNGHTTEMPEELYASALTLVETSQPQEALEQAKKLWLAVQDQSTAAMLPSLNLLGEISVELGEIDEARTYFEKAATLDPEGTVEGPLGGGAEKFLWLAQLNEEGGQQSVHWFEKGVQALQREIAALESGQDVGLSEEELLIFRVEKKRKLAKALCGIVEVYMTDLSWEDDAEARCESLVTQAMTVEDETSPEILQTLASVRLSQERKEDAQAALKRSMAVWEDLEPEDPEVPDFACRISLTRLLMEAELESDAMDVLERLVQEDDQSVEAWYLGGWCQHLVAGKIHAEGTNGNTNGDVDANGTSKGSSLLRGSRRWLSRSLELHDTLDYEDERLKQHAEELVQELEATLGPQVEGDDGDESGEEWSGIENDSDAQDGADDVEMEDS
ncbi:hypothetical protein B0A48_07870 [Cryoendolithus antarcticus]|uniref:Uncharacterized protein n=1 Tax=Cryoendolithus antarcticus TaxID=1507870 RepID=A0A1V8T0B0_9PEZI|nr:hypothetical protein B0A48_07870 [Cryoendolithus antarcticus]